MRRMRPRFRLELPFGRAELLARLDRELTCQGCPGVATYRDNHIEVEIRQGLRHFWSPRLSLEMLEGSDGKLVLHGLFGPNPSVWTMFLAAYAFLGLCATFGAFFGLSQLTIGSTPWALLSVPLALLLAVIPYAASLYGQHLASDQMDMLHCSLSSTLGIPPETLADCDGILGAGVITRRG